MGFDRDLGEDVGVRAPGFGCTGEAGGVEAPGVAVFAVLNGGGAAAGGDGFGHVGVGGVVMRGLEGEGGGEAGEGQECDQAGGWLAHSSVHVALAGKGHRKCGLVGGGGTPHPAGTPGAG